MDVNPIDPMDPQWAYARALRWMARIALVLLVIAFALYVSGALPDYVDIDRLPRLWGMSSSQLLKQLGVPAGMGGWALHMGHGDMLVLGALALLASLSVICLVVAMPIFFMRGERAMFFACLLQVGVLALALSGLLLR